MFLSKNLEHVGFYYEAIGIPSYPCNDPSGLETLTLQENG
jgi:hypothetical protein